MSSKRSARSTPSHPARGFAMMSAIFLLVVLALLGGMMVALSSTQHVGQARDLLGARAYYAARAGIEWGVFQVLRNGGACAPASVLPALGGSAEGFTVQVACSASAPEDEAGTMAVVYRLTATATRGTPGSLDFAERQLEASVSMP